MTPRILSLNEKIELIKTYEKGKLSVKQLGTLFNCSVDIVYRSLRQKHELIELWKNGNGLVKKIPQSSKIKEINHLTWEWYLCSKAKNVPITGSMIKSKALKIAEKMSCSEFNASYGWLEDFITGHNINECLVNYEYEKDFDDWKEELGLLTEGYDPEDIYIGDEMGLLFRAIPNITTLVKKVNCEHGELSNERLTIFLCTNMEGSFEKPLIIGKEKKPRCFKNLNRKKIPIIWQANNKAWMTETIMDDWLYIFNNKMKEQNRKVILFLNNTACCPHLILTNVFLAWLPCHMLGHTHPMDQGIIYKIKLNFRKMVLKSLLASMDNIESINDLANKINVLDAILWLNKSISLIKPDLVKKCFKKSMFDLDLSQLTDEPLLDNDFKLLCSTINEEVDSDEYVNVDRLICTSRKLASKGTEEYISDDENDNVPCESSIMTDNDIKMYKNALVEIKHLEMFVLNQNNENELLESITNVKCLIEKEIILSEARS